MEPLETPGIHTQLGWRTQWRRLIGLNWSDIRGLFVETIDNWYSHNVPRLGASVAFYTLLSMAPLLVIVVAIAGLVFGREAAEGQLVWQIQDLIGRQAAETVQALLKATQSPGAGALASILGTLTLAYGATAAVAELRAALNTIWCVPKKEETGLRSLLSVLLERTFAFATVVGIGFLLLVSLSINAAVTALSDRYNATLPVPALLLQYTDLIVSFFVVSVLFALIYKLLPDLELEWRDVIPGALFTSFLFSTGKVLIGMYLGKASIGSTYGAAGSLVILLLWVYYSAQIFFLGAEFTQAYAEKFGSRPCNRTRRDVKIVSRIEDAEKPAETGKKLVELS